MKKTITLLFICSLSTLMFSLTTTANDYFESGLQGWSTTSIDFGINNRGTYNIQGEKIYFSEELSFVNYLWTNTPTAEAGFKKVFEKVEVTILKENNSKDSSEKSAVLGKANALLAITCGEVVVSTGNSVPVENGNVDVPTDAGLCEAEVSFVWPMPTTFFNRIELLIGSSTTGIKEGDFIPVSCAEGTVTEFRFIEIRGDGSATGSECSFTVTVTDSEDPLTPTLANVTGECSATATAPTTTDNCSGTITGTTSDPLTYTVQGPHVITWNFDDGNGNAINVTQDVVIDDITNPLTPVLADVTGECSATAVAPTTTDACSGTIIGTTSDPLTYTVQGPHVITWKFDDGNGNAINVTQDVVIDDITNPLTPVLADVTGECSATTVAPTTTDACSGTITGTTLDPLTYTAQGTHTITWNFDDGNGNATTANQNVIIDDITKPTLTAIANRNENVGASCSFTIPDYTGLTTASDNCTASGSIVKTQIPVSGTVISGHNTTRLITITANDGNGNTATTTFTITLKDITPPTIICPGDKTANTSANGTGDCTTTVNLGFPAATDNCGVASIVAKIGSAVITPSSHRFAAGSTIVTWVVTDKAGLTATCDQIVTVIDNENPIISCPQDQNVFFDTLCGFTLLDYTTNANTYTSDNCDNNNLTITQSPAPGTIIYGITTITLTAQDAASNISTCTFKIIPTDNIAPTAVVRDNYTAFLTANGTLTLAASNLENGSTDNCGIVNTTVSPNSFNCGDIGKQTVTFTVYDKFGNSDSVTTEITIVDKIPPTMICRNYVVVIDAITRVATIKASDIDNGSNDACGIASLTLSKYVFPDMNSAYSEDVILTATDVNGNKNTCTAKVFVEQQKIYLLI